MIAEALLASPLARKFGIYALAALLLVGAVTAWRWQASALREERDSALIKQGEASGKLKGVEKEVVQLKSSLEWASMTVAAQQKAEQDRVTVQQKIEVKRNERSKRNSATLAAPQNRALADTPLTDGMLRNFPAELRDQ